MTVSPAFARVVTALFDASLVIDTVGAVVSTVTVLLVLALLPAVSVAVTATVCVPSASVTMPLIGVVAVLSTVN